MNELRRMQMCLKSMVNVCNVKGKKDVYDDSYIQTLVVEPRNSTDRVDECRPFIAADKEKQMMKNYLLHLEEKCHGMGEEQCFHKTTDDLELNKNTKKINTIKDNQTMLQEEEEEGEKHKSEYGTCLIVLRDNKLASGLCGMEELYTPRRMKNKREDRIHYKSHNRNNTTVLSETEARKMKKMATCAFLSDIMTSSKSNSQESKAGCSKHIGNQKMINNSQGMRGGNNMHGNGMCSGGSSRGKSMQTKSRTFNRRK